MRWYELDRSGSRFIACSMSFIVCEVLCAVFSLIVVCYLCVVSYLYVVSYLSTTVTG
jgi:hypothetical protein